MTEEEITTDVIVEDTGQDDYPFDLTIVSLSENDIEIHIMGYGKMLTEESISVPTFLTNDGKERLFELQKFKSSEAHTSYRFVFSGGCAFFEEPTPTTVTFDFDGYSFEEAVEVEYSLCMVGEAPSGCNSSPTKGAHPLGLILLFALLISSAICLRYCRR